MNDETPCAEPAEDLLKAGAARIEQLETALRKMAEHSWINEHGETMTAYEVAWKAQELAKKALADGEPKSK